MKIEYLEMSGFRGFCKKTRIHFAEGYNVFMGRNGAGKSIIIDAIDFALTGSINVFTTDLGLQTNKTRHIWWEGETNSAEQYVKLGLKNNSNKKIEIYRDSNNVLTENFKDYDEFVQISENLKRWSKIVVQNSLIRVETISNLTLKISDESRFDLIGGLFGDTFYPDILIRINDVLEKLEKSKRKLESDLISHKTQLDFTVREQSRQASILTQTENDLASILYEKRNNPLEINRKQLEDEITRVHAKAVNLDKSIENLARIKEMYYSVTNDIVREKINMITPMLQELFKRLKPHQDWIDVDIKFGKVLDSIDLLVGEGKDPNFLFSSGQKKITGIAFLLAMYLSRPRINWNTLILDDPFDQVDHYHSINLTEVFSAVIRDNNQIIVAIENPSLAEHVCRRLRGVCGRTGRRYELSTGDDGAIRVESDDEINPDLKPILKNGD